MLAQTWTAINIFFWWGSLAFYFGFLAAYSAILYFYDFYWVAFQLMSRATFWLLFIQVMLSMQVVLDWLAVLRCADCREELHWVGFSVVPVGTRHGAHLRRSRPLVRGRSVLH